MICDRDGNQRRRPHGSSARVHKRAPRGNELKILKSEQRLTLGDRVGGESSGHGGTGTRARKNVGRIAVSHKTTLHTAQIRESCSRRARYACNWANASGAPHRVPGLGGQPHAPRRARAARRGCRVVSHLKVAALNNNDTLLATQVYLGLHSLTPLNNLVSPVP